MTDDVISLAARASRFVGAVGRRIRPVARAVAWAILVTLGGATGVAEERAPWPVAASRPALIHYDGMVNETNRRFLERSVADARAAGADAVVIAVDSPGGYLTEALETGEFLAGIDDLPTIVFVSHEAISGGAILALGASAIVATPGARFGDAGVIEFDSGGMFRYAPEKIRSDAALRVRELAEKRGRSPLLAEAMVNLDLVVYRATDPATGRTVFLTEAEAVARGATPAKAVATEANPPVAKTPESGAAESDAAETVEAESAVAGGNGDEPGVVAVNAGGAGEAVPEMVFETRPGHFFEVTGRRAAELGLAATTVADEDDLLRSLGASSFVRVYRWGWRETAAVVLSNWFISALLLIVGLIALKVELSVPGISVGGLIAVTCFVLFFYGRFLGGTAAWLEVLLFVLGMVFLAVELFVLPGFGVAGILGVLMMVGAVMLAFQDFTVPQSGKDWQTVAWSASTIVVVGFVTGVTLLTIGNYLGAGTIIEPLVLRPPTAAELRPEGMTAPFGGDKATEAVILPGQAGTTTSPLRPLGRAEFAGRVVDVSTDGDYVDRGQAVEVIEIRGHRIVVRPKGGVVG